MADKEFVKGLYVKAPRDGAPQFVKGAISIKTEDLKAWLRPQTDEWINIDIKESQNGKWYAEINTWKPKDQTKPANDFDDDLPF